MRDQGKTIVFVTHDMAALQRFCHRAMFFERGPVVHIGEAQDVAERYLEINFGRDPEALNEGSERGDGDARVLEVWVEDEKGGRQRPCPRASGSCSAPMSSSRSTSTTPSRGTDPQRGAEGGVGRITWTRAQRSFLAGEQALFSFTFENVLAPGRYSPVVKLAHRGAGLDVMDRYESASRSW